METQHCLSVVVGCPLFLRQLPSGPCLILDSDSSTFENLCSEALPSEHPWPLTFQQVVLSDLSGENISWNRFSDRRFDGPWDLSVVQPDYRNLRQVSSISVQCQTLADILEAQNCLQEIGSRFQLIIRQGDPLRILMGAETWLHRCISVILRGVDIPLGHRSECESFLSSRGFSPVGEDGLSVMKNTMSELLQNQNYLPQQFTQAFGRNSYWKALEALFPYQFYRSLRPDLAELDDHQLIEHFCADGLKEGIRLEGGVEMQFAVRALRHVFPYSLYRALCPDLKDLDDQELLLHFCQNGLDQRIDLSEESVKSFLDSYPVSEVEVLKSRVKELEQYLNLSRRQVEELRESLLALVQNNDQ